MRHVQALVAVLCSIGCGGDARVGRAIYCEEDPVIDRHLRLPLSSATRDAVSGIRFTFPAGVEAFRTMSATDLQFAPAGAVEITSSGRRASGTVSEACDFRIDQSTLGPPSTLTAGAILSSGTCLLSMRTTGCNVAWQVHLEIGAEQSRDASMSITLQIDRASGKIIVNGHEVGSVEGA